MKAYPEESGDVHEDYPVKIDLGKEVDDYPSPCEMASKNPKNPKNGKKRTVYPCLYLSGVEGLEDVPKEGHAIITFKRISMTVRDRNGEQDNSVELEIEDIHFQSKTKEDENEDIAEGMKRLMEEQEEESEEEED